MCIRDSIWFWKILVSLEKFAFTNVSFPFKLHVDYFYLATNSLNLSFLLLFIMNGFKSFNTFFSCEFLTADVITFYFVKRNIHNIVILFHIVSSTSNVFPFLTFQQGTETAKTQYTTCRRNCIEQCHSCLLYTSRCV